MNKDTEVTQADRDAAAEYFRLGMGSLLWDDLEEEARKGYHDEEPDCLVRMFARHRTTSLAAQDGLVEALREIAACEYPSIKGYAARTFCGEATGNEYSYKEPIAAETGGQAISSMKKIAEAALASIEVKQ